MALPLITVPYISRVLKPEGVGIYAYTNSIVQYFMLLAMLGIGTYGNKMVAIARDNKK
jgi:O-antigen/teichoic acid export membrane protein